MAFVALCVVVAAPSVVRSQDESLNTAIIADNQEDTYRRCLLAADRDPERGLDMAMRWGRLSGGEPASHCAAVVLIGLGDAEEAARRLEALAAESTGRVDVRAGLLNQAARAWMSVGRHEHALEILNNAIGFYDKEVGFFFDRSLCYAALGNYWPAVDDLNRVLDAEPDSIEALVLRGSAYRHLDVTDLAADDIDRALQLQPDNVDALLEQGLLAQQNGATFEARQAWMRVLALDPDSSAGDAVRQHLERLDVSVDAPVP